MAIGIRQISSLCSTSTATVLDEVRTAVEPDIQQMGEELDEVYREEAKRLAECKEVAVEVPEEVSEMEVMKEKYGAMKLKCASVMAELEDIKKAGKKKEEIFEEAATWGDKTMGR